MKTGAMKTVIGYTSIALLVLAAVVAALLLTALGDGPLAALFPVGQVAPVDFATLRLAAKPNQFLMCPRDLCDAKAHAQSPVFEVSVERLAGRWRQVIVAQPRVELLAEDPDERQFDYVQRSARWRFPDIITLRLIPLSPSLSTLAVYSRAVYGRRDFGVNRERIEVWVGALGEGP